MQKQLDWGKIYLLSNFLSSRSSNKVAQTLEIAKLPPLAVQSESKRQYWDEDVLYEERKAAVKCAVMSYSNVDNDGGL